MRRWQVTAVLVVLAGAGISLATGLPVGVAAIAWLADAGREVSPLPVEPPEPSPVLPRVEPAPLSIPELTDPIAPVPVPVLVLPPDPVPVHYGCGGRAVPANQPVPACGMG